MQKKRKKNGKKEKMTNGAFYSDETSLATLVIGFVLTGEFFKCRFSFDNGGEGREGRGWEGRGRESAEKGERKA